MKPRPVVCRPLIHDASFSTTIRREKKPVVSSSEQVDSPRAVTAERMCSGRVVATRQLRRNLAHAQPSHFLQGSYSWPVCESKPSDTDSRRTWILSVLCFHRFYRVSSHNCNITLLRVCACVPVLMSHCKKLPNS
jgi:hypothetical protein